MQSKQRWLTRAAVVLGLAAIVAWGWFNRARYTPVDTGSRAPDFQATTLGGEPASLRSYEGDVVLLNIWATWCAPCRYEMPALERLHRRLGAEGLAIVAVSVDAPPGQLDALARLGGDVDAYVRDLGITFDVLRDPEGDILRRYRIAGLPTTYVLDREGRVVEKVIGPAEWDDDEHIAMFRKLLKG